MIKEMKQLAQVTGPVDTIKIISLIFKAKQNLISNSSPLLQIELVMCLILLSK
jgi:hypothetical protein